MFGTMREAMAGRFEQASAAVKEHSAPLLKLFQADQRTMKLEDFLGSVLDESFVSKAAQDAAAKSVCHFPICCDRAEQCTG